MAFHLYQNSCFNISKFLLCISLSSRSIQYCSLCNISVSIKFANCVQWYQKFFFCINCHPSLIFNIAWRCSKIKVITLKSKHEFCRDWNAVVRVVNGTCNFKTLWDWKTSIFLQARDFLNLAKEVVKKYEITRLVLFS